MAPEDLEGSNPAPNLPTTTAGWIALSATLKRFVAHQLRGRASQADTNDVEEITQETLLHLIQRDQTGLYPNYTTTNQALTIATGLIANKRRGDDRQHAYWTDLKEPLNAKREILNLPWSRSSTTDWRFRGFATTFQTTTHQAWFWRQHFSVSRATPKRTTSV